MLKNGTGRMRATIAGLAFGACVALAAGEVVSDQASDWEPEKARQITATVLQQNPDLCAIFGHWDVHTIGAGNVVKDAGLSGKGLVYATGGGEQGEACKAIENGTLSRERSYDADGQGRDAGTMIDLLLQGATSNGSMLTVESPLKIIKAGADYDPTLCWKMPPKK
jgi:ribose transport system substrate-binding protein